jgi:threonine/homoserine/homoserine lactone efflux protein
MLTAFLLGTTIGLIAVVPPGPVAVALVDIAASRGRRSGVHGGLGVVGGDVTAGAAALSVIALGTRLPEAFFTTTQVVSAGALVAIGIGLITRPDVGQRLTARIGDPFRAMFTITALTPSVFSAWVALFTAMPFANDLLRLVVFASGALASSLLWHVTLGGTSGSMATWITTERRTRLARAGGVAMLGVAAWSLI